MNMILIDQETNQYKGHFIKIKIIKKEGLIELKIIKNLSMK